MFSMLLIWFERHQRRATVVIGAAAVLLAQLGLAYVAGDRYQAAIGRALNPPTAVSPADTPQVGPPLRVAAGSRDAGTAPTPAPTIEGRTAGNELSTPVAAPEGVGVTPSGPPPSGPPPPDGPPPAPQPEPDRGAGESPPTAVVRQGAHDEEPDSQPSNDRDRKGDREDDEEPEAASDHGGARRDPEPSDGRGPKGDREDDEGSEQVLRASARSERCSASWSERPDERVEACEERGRDQRDERDESRVDGRGQEDEHRSSADDRAERSD